VRRRPVVCAGAKPAELRVQQVSRSETVINARTSATIGQPLPAAVRLRATEVIE
jgi:hypothetical protein